MKEEMQAGPEPTNDALSAGGALFAGAAFPSAAVFPSGAAPTSDPAYRSKNAADWWNQRDSVVMLRATDADQTKEMNQLNIEQIVRLHLSTVFRVLRRAGVAVSDCDDVTQEVFLVVARRIADVEPGKERAFCVGVAVRKASDYRRSVGRRPRLVENVELEAVSPSPNPEQATAISTQLTLLDTHLRQLSLEQQEVFILVAIEELSFDEAAHALGIPAGTVSSRLHRARAALLTLIERQASGDE